MKIKVLIADDHPVVRAGLKSIIHGLKENIEVIAEAANGQEVLEIARSKPVDVYILDISMPILNGIETTTRIKKMDSRNKVVIFSFHDSKSFVEKALMSGAQGFIVKDNIIEEVTRAIKEVYRGRYYLSPSISHYVVSGFLGNSNKDEPTTKLSYLTGREKEILQLIAEGYINKEIAVHLDISTNTVFVHRNNIMKKLNLHRHADLIRYAIKEKIAQL